MMRIATMTAATASLMLMATPLAAQQPAPASTGDAELLRLCQQQQNRDPQERVWALVTDDAGEKICRPFNNQAGSFELAGLARDQLIAIGAVSAVGIGTSLADVSQDKPVSR